MFLELIATIFAGIAMAGIVMLINKGTGGRLPRWLAPVGAGAAMLAATISSEYSWYGRISGSLPENVVVAETVEKSSFYQPWTYIRPYVVRFVAVDQTATQTNPKAPDLRLTDLYFFGRWSPIRKLPVVADCAANKQAVLAPGARFEGDGTIADVDWVQMTPDAPTLNTICNGASE